MPAPVVWAVVVALVSAAGWLAVVPAAERRSARLADGSAGSPALLQRAVALATQVLGRVGVGPASRRRRARDRVRVIQSLGALAAELEVGQPPAEALLRTAGTPPVWPVAAASLQLGGDVPAALCIDAQRHDVLAQLAACWQVGAESGAGLAAAVTRLAASARAAEEVRVDLEGQLAGPRATARMLAVLPLVGIGFGTMLGSEPLAWLLTSLPGRLCLAAGVALTLVGLWWTGRIAARVERLL